MTAEDRDEVVNAYEEISSSDGVVKEMTGDACLIKPLHLI